MAIVRFLVKFLFGLFALLILVGLFLPSEVEVERSQLIEAAPSQIFPYLNSMKMFNQWSPWAHLDPDTEYTFEGPESGVGSRMHWQSKVAQVGAGSQVITASVADKRVVMELDFGEEGNGSATLELLPDSDGTLVKWRFRTDFGWDLLGRYFGLFLDTLLGPSYEQGLANLKKRVQRVAQSD